MNQYIHTVLGGKAFGDGSLGSVTLASSGTQSQTKGTASGTSGTQALTTSVTSFANGDVVLIIQMQGTNYGKWEINRVLSGGGSTSLTMVNSLGATFSSSGNARAQIIKVPMYLDYTINSGVTLSGPSWDGSTGGIVLLAVRRTLTLNGGISVSGNNGSTGQGLTAGGVGIGFRGGNADSVNTDASSQGSAGESYNGGFPVYTVNADGNGGGGGRHQDNPGGASGGGGGNGGTGYPGEREGGSSNQGGLGGGVGGSANLTELILGGGGGGASKEAVNTIGSGGAGAGAVIIFCRELIIHASTGSINLNGGAGGVAFVGGGGGSGGSCLILCQIATLNTNRISATGGLGSSSGTAGDGGVGRVSVHYSLSYSGSSNPSLTAVLDTKLREVAAGSQIIM